MARKQKKSDSVLLPPGMGQSKLSHADKQRRANRLAMIIVLCVMPAALVFLPTSMIFLSGMVPTFVAIVVDRDPQRYAAIAVGSMNFAGVMPALLDLWFEAHTISQAGRILSSPMTWLVLLLAASCGWGFYHAFPPLAARYLRRRNTDRVARNEQLCLDLEEEWGADISQKIRSFGDDHSEENAEPKLF